MIGCLIGMLCFSLLYGQCDVCGTYKGKNDRRWHSLKINSDSTFEYEYVDQYATLMRATTRGKWQIENKELVLNGDYDIEEYEVEEKKVDLCADLQALGIDTCQNYVKVEILDLEEQYIWAFKKLMLNDDTTSVGNLGFENLDGGETADKISAYILAAKVEKIVFFNGFYDLLEIEINNPQANLIRVKGNFADQLWYTYIKDQKWKIKKNKLTQNERFGSFKRK